MDLINDNIYKLIYKISLPAILGLLFSSIYNLIDTYYAGNVSVEALTGISITFPLYMVIIAISSGMTVGIGVLFGNAFGAKNQEESQRILNNGFFIITLFGLILTISGVLISPLIMSLLSDNKEVVSGGSNYIQILFLGSFLFIYPGFLNAILNSVGDTVSYRNILFVGMILNIFLDFFLVNILNLSITGIAIGTLIVQFIQFIYLFYKFKTNNFLKHLKIFEKENITAKKCFYIIQNIIGPTLNVLVFSVGIFIYNLYISKVGSDLALSGFGVAYKIEQILIIPVSGIGVATTTLISQNKGAQKYERVREIFVKTLLISFIFLLFGEVVLWLLRYPLFSFFTTSPQVVQQGITYLKVEMFIIPMYSILTVANNAIIAVNRPNISFYITFLRQIILPLVFFYVAVYIFKITQVKYIYIIMAFINYISLSIMFYFANKYTKENYTK